MGLWKDLWVRLLSLLNRDREAWELAEEIRFHLEMETRKNEAEGMSPREARRGAYQAFGGVERWTEEWREARGVGPIERIARELRLALRRLVREPGLFVPALGTLALGLGSTATVFALVYSVLLRPLPYPEPDQLVAVGHATPAFGVPEAGQSAGTFTHYRAASRSFSELALFYENAVSVSVTDGDAPEHVRVAMVTPSFFRVLQVQPLRGRWFQDGEGVWEPGQPRTPVIISETLWIRRYGSDPAIVGGEIEINQSSRRVVGIMPADFAFPHPQTDVWYVTEERPDRADLRFLTSRSIGRLHEGISPQSAQSELNRIRIGTAGSATTPKLDAV